MARVVLQVAVSVEEGSAITIEADEDSKAVTLLVTVVKLL
jgi:hypothetical protein